MVFKDRKCTLYGKQGNIVGMGAKQGGLFLLSAQAQIATQERANIAASKNLTWYQWHRCFGHISITSLQRLECQNLVQGFSVDPTSIPSNTCEACIQVKLSHKAFPSEAQNHLETPGERVMGNVWGPIGVKSIGGFYYFIIFLNDAKRYNTVLFLRNKTEAADRMEQHAEKIKQQFGKYPRYMRFDNGKELVNQCIKNWAAKNSIEIKTTAPYSPSQNGVAERYNCTLLELARAMLISKNLPSYLWDEAVSYANFIRNRVPTRALENMTPYEGWHSKKPDVSNLREFGCDVWVLDESNKTKLHPQSKKMVFVGFNEGSKSVLYYNPQHRNIKTSRNVAFNENEEPKEVDIPGLPSEGERNTSTSAQTSPEIIPASPEASPTSNTPQIQFNEPQNQSTPTKSTPELLRRSTRSTQPVDYKLSRNPDAQKPSTVIHH